MQNMNKNVPVNPAVKCNNFFSIMETFCEKGKIVFPCRKTILQQKFL